MSAASNGPRPSARPRAAAGPCRRARSWSRRALPAIGLLALALLIAAAPAVPADDEPADASPLAGLAWMAGTWVTGGGTQHLEETWSAPAHDSLVGMFRWARDGKVWLYELMSIEADASGAVDFRLRHFSRGLEPWDSEAEGVGVYRMISNEGQEVVFEDPRSSDPRQFVYSREGDVLTVMLVGVDDEGRPDREHADRFQLELSESR